MRHKYLIFDMDGVLINTEPLHYRCWKIVFQRRGLKIDYENYKACIGSTNRFLLDLIYQNYRVDFRNQAEDLIRDFKEIKREILQKEGIPPMPGAVETIRTLARQGFVLAVASSSPYEAIVQEMTQIGINSCFTCLCSGEDVVHPKPAPDIFLKAVQGLGAESSQCAVIEDSENGSRAARAAGLFCYGLHNPDSGDQNLAAADEHLEAIMELLQREIF